MFRLSSVYWFVNVQYNLEKTRLMVLYYSRFKTSGVILSWESINEKYFTNLYEFFHKSENVMICQNSFDQELKLKHTFY